MRHDKVQKSISAYLCRTISHMPARLDLVQGLTGLILVLFIAVHLLLEASIVISKEAMLAVTIFFEGYYFFGESYPGIISFLAAFIFVILILAQEVKVDLPVVILLITLPIQKILLL